MPPNNHRHVGEKIYLERNCIQFDLAVTVVAKSLPTIPFESCARMIKINEDLEHKLATFFQSKLQLSHPEIRDMTSVEINISCPLDGSRDTLYRRRQNEMRVIIKTLAQELASLEKLEYVKIVLGWVRGQTFVEEGHGNDFVNPLCDVLLDGGVRVGVELLIWKSSTTSWTNEEEGWKVKDLRRSMTPKEEADLRDRIGSRRTKLGRPDMVIGPKHRNPVTLVEISELRIGRYEAWW